MQFEFPGALALADGRYLARDAGDDGPRRVLILKTLKAPPAFLRGRRRAREEGPAPIPSSLPLARATAVRAFQPFDSTEEAERWLRAAVATDEAVDALVQEGIALLNRALHAQATASADPWLSELSPERAVRARIGYASGEELAADRFTAAREVDTSARGGSRRRRREEELRPQERVAAVLGGREGIDACETLLLRARADLNGGRLREAALQLRIGLDALLAELAGALVDPRHKQDMKTLEKRRREAAEAAEMALRGELDPEREENVRELVSLCERVLRRRRVLHG